MLDVVGYVHNMSKCTYYTEHFTCPDNLCPDYSCLVLSSLQFTSA